MKKSIFFCAVMALGLLTACGGGSGDPVTPPVTPDVPDPEKPDPEKPAVKKQINLGSRVADGKFENGDAMGVYVVAYNGSSQGSFEGAGNYVDNEKFTYQGGEWKSSKTLYWKDDNTKADFYAYAPHQSVQNAHQCAVKVAADQQDPAKMKQSDFLWGKTEGQAPTESLISLSMNHLMSKVSIQFEAGAGVTAQELKDAALKVGLCNLKTEAAVDLKTGLLKAVGSTGDMVPTKAGDLNYQAIIVPQTVNDQKLIEVAVNEDNFSLKQTIKFESGKQYNIKARITRKTTGFDVTVSDWTIVEGEFGGNMTPDSGDDQARIPVKITSASNGNFTNGSRLGLYISMYQNGQPSALVDKGNYLDNACFTYRNGSWNPEQEIFWQDAKTTADFYAYYPYSSNAIASEQDFKVSSDQQTKEAYEASDFLWTKTAAQTPSNPLVSLNLKHLMSKVIVKLQAGKGFTAEEVKKGLSSVQLCNLSRTAKISLGTGNVESVGAAENILPYCIDAFTYEALIAPQQVSDKKLVKVVLNNQPYNLVKSMTFESGKQYTLTVTVSKSSSGINVSVSDWEIVEGDFGGIVVG